MTFGERYLNRHILFEIAPGIIFLIANFASGLMWATAAVIIATIIFTLLGVVIERRIPMFPVVTVLLVLALGGATLLFQDETFIKIRPTIGRCLFATSLALGLLLRPPLLARALEGQIYLSETGWRILTLRWIIFTLLTAGLNEVIWRTQSTDTWVTLNTVITILSIIGYIIITRFTAPTYWLETNDENEKTYLS